MKTFLIGLAASLGLVLSAAALPANSQTPSASFDVGSIHVDKYDSGGPALILIPGLTDSAAVWSGTITQFEPQHTIYALTLGGFGGRAAPSAPLLDKADADIATLITQQNIDRPVLIGHSLGGHLAIRFAAEHSAQLRGVIAVDGLPVFPGYENMTPAQRTAAGSQMTGPMRNMSAAQLETAERQMILPYMTQARNVDAVAAAGAGADPAATAQYMQEMFLADLRPQLGNVTVPLLEIMPFDATLDPNNPQMPIRSADQKLHYYAGLLANAKTVKIAPVNDSRHFVMYDQPQQLYALIQSFLAQLSSAALSDRA